MRDPILAITEAMDGAVAAQQSGDYSAALKKVETAWMHMVALPDSEFENEKLEWSRDGVHDLMEWLKARANEQAKNAQNDSGGGGIFRPVPITYTREQGQ